MVFKEKSVFDMALKKKSLFGALGGIKFLHDISSAINNLMSWRLFF